MILKISAENFDLSEELSKYAQGKLESLDKYVLRKDRPTTLVEAIFSEQGMQRTCQLTVKLRREEFTARETTRHTYVSLDIAVAAVEQRLRDYRREHPSAVRSYLRQKRAGLS